MSRDDAITVLLIDENEAVCRLLARSLQGVPEFRLIAHTTNPMLAAELAHQYSPDVIIADFKRGPAPRADGVAWLGKSSPKSRIIVHASYYEEGEREAFEAAGAFRCLLKGLGMKDLAPEIIKLAGQPVAHHANGATRPE